VTASPPWFVPIKVTELKPVSAVVGKVPTSPVIVVGPVLVIPAPARTAKLSAVPRPIGGCAAWALPVTTSITSNASRGSPRLFTRREGDLMLGTDARRRETRAPGLPLRLSPFWVTTLAVLGRQVRRTRVIPKHEFSVLNSVF
jgi:hypothetical protein